MPDNLKPCPLCGKPLAGNPCSVYCLNNDCPYHVTPALHAVIAARLERGDKAVELLREMRELGLCSHESYRMCNVDGGKLRCTQDCPILDVCGKPLPNVTGSEKGEVNG